MDGQEIWALSNRTRIIMIDFISTHIGELASLFTVTSIILGALFLSHRRLHKDMMDIRDDTKAAHARIDAMGIRIDGIYDVIIKMLDKR